MTHAAHGQIRLFGQTSSIYTVIPSFAAVYINIDRNVSVILTFCFRMAVRGDLSIAQELHDWAVNCMHFVPTGRHSGARIPTVDDFQA